MGSELCEKPPKGWRCTRDAGHDGPCAAVSKTDDPYAPLRESDQAYADGVREWKNRAEAAEARVAFLQIANGDAGALLKKYDVLVPALEAKLEQSEARVASLEAALATEEALSFRAQVAKAESENAALREKLAVAERKLAMYEAATLIEFGDGTGSRNTRNGWGAFLDEDGSYFVIPRGMTLGLGNEALGLTRDEAIAKAFELSGGKLGGE